MNNPTTKQMEALRNFKVPEAKIQAMSFDQASAMLAKLIGQARGNGNRGKPTTRFDPSSEARATLAEATKSVSDHFGIKDRSELKESHIVLIQEVSRQLYGLKHWVEKSSPRLTGQPI